MIGVHRIKRLRKELGIRCRQKRKFKATTNSNHSLTVAKNLVAQKFTVQSPNQIWLTDITYIRTREGWLYLAAHKDLFNGEIVGYALDKRMTSALVMKSLFRAVAKKTSTCRPNSPFGPWKPILFQEILEVNKTVQDESVDEP